MCINVSEFQSVSVHATTETRLGSSSVLTHIEASSPGGRLAVRSHWPAEAACPLETARSMVFPAKRRWFPSPHLPTPTCPCCSDEQGLIQNRELPLDINSYALILLWRASERWRRISGKWMWVSVSSGGRSDIGAFLRQNRRGQRKWKAMGSKQSSPICDDAPLDGQWLVRHFTALNTLKLKKHKWKNWKWHLLYGCITTHSPYSSMSYILPFILKCFTGELAVCSAKKALH